MFRATVIVCLAFLTGCSSFNRDWRAAGKLPCAGDPVAGRWEGIWKSDANQHSDKLRCLLTQVSDGKYEARFRAKYKKVLSFSYTATFQGTKKDSEFSFSGDADLGKLAGGIYYYRGEISPTNFVSTYRSKYDHGTFHLARPTK
ncbi:MAG: hypothetical protein JWM68_3097 [Verrucomicrobiales bacterium]|nr:hypothetical protein [Verrucomicrobiales bacterium]